MNKFYKSKGITLVALVITIIILLILAGITILQLTENGLFENSKLAKEKTENLQIKENEILSDYETTINQYIDGNIDGTRDTVTINKQEYEELKNKVENIGEIYNKSNTITISSRSAWVNVTNATWTLPAGTWLMDCKVTDDNNGTGIFTFVLGAFGFQDTYWKSDGNYAPVHCTGIITLTEETTSYFRYYQSMATGSRNITVNVRAVRIK